jgi:hypothetical protein
MADAALPSHPNPITSDSAVHSERDLAASVAARMIGIVAVAARQEN